MELQLGVVLDAEAARVQALMQQATRLQSALRAWHKADQSGQLPARERAATQAVELARALTAPLAATATEFDFDVAEYLTSGAWRAELHAVAAERYGLQLLEEDEHLISSPVTVRAQAGRGVLQIGGKTWSKLHPAAVAEELKRLREGNQLRNARETLEALYGVWKQQGQPAVLKFRVVYDLFCLTPGFKRDNPLVAFAQRVHALHESDLRSTRDSRACWFEAPSGDPRARDILTFVAEDGQALRYYGMVFE